MQVLLDSNREMSQSMRHLSKFAKLDAQKPNGQAQNDETFSEKSFDPTKPRPVQVPNEMRPQVQTIETIISKLLENEDLQSSFSGMSS